MHRFPRHESQLIKYITRIHEKSKHDREYARSSFRLSFFTQPWPWRFENLTFEYREIWNEGLDGTRIESETSIRSNVHMSALLQTMLLRFFARALVAVPASLLLLASSFLLLLLLLLLLGDTSRDELKLDRREYPAWWDASREPIDSLLFLLGSASTLAAGHGAVYKWFK